MKHILYQVDKDFNIINKFMFKDATVAYEYIDKHISEESDVNFLLDMLLLLQYQIEIQKVYR